MLPNPLRCGRPSKVSYRIPRSLAHVQILKHRAGHRLQSVTICYRHGKRKRAQEALMNLHSSVPNTSAIERRNGTARQLNASQRCKTLAFARHPLAKLALGWWTLTAYNWCRPHRMLQAPLRKPTDKKKYVQQTPAMALGIANRMFTVAELAITPAYPLRGVG